MYGLGSLHSIANMFPKAEEGPVNIDDDRFVVRDDERYTISDIELKDVGQHTKYTYSITRLKPFMSTRGHCHEDDSDEVYYFQQGTGMMFLGNKGFPVKGGDIVWVPPRVFHKLVNRDSQSLVAHSISPKIVKRPAF